MRKEAMPARLRVTVLDWMVLVAATAVGFGLFEPVVGGDLLDTFSWREKPAMYPVVGYEVRLAVRRNRFLAVMVGSWTLAIVILRLRRGGGRMRMMREPGLVGGVTAMVALCWTLPWCIWMIRRSDGQTWRWLTIDYAVMSIGVAVAAGWVVLWLSGRWRGRLTWLDQVGRGLALFWIAQPLLALMRMIVD